LQLFSSGGYGLALAALAVTDWRLQRWRLRIGAWSVGGYGLALAALRLVDFRENDSYQKCTITIEKIVIKYMQRINNP